MRKYKVCLINLILLFTVLAFGIPLNAQKKVKLKIQEVQEVESAPTSEVPGDDERLIVEVDSADTLQLSSSDRKEIAEKIVSLLEKDGEQDLELGKLGVYNMNLIIIEKEVEEVNRDEKGKIKSRTQTMLYDTINAEKVVVQMQHGYISEIRLFAKQKVLDTTLIVSYVTNFPTSLMNYYRNNWDNKFLTAESPHFAGYRIKLSNLLYYNTLNSRLYPESKMYVLTKSAPVASLKRSYNLGNNIEGRIYTDFNGLDGEAFGIIQTDLKMRLNLITRNVHHNWRMVLVNHAEIKINTRKFDSQFDTLEISDVTEKVNSSELLARSFRQLNFELNLMHYYNVVHFDFDIGYQLNSNRIQTKADSSFYIANLHSINFSPSWYIPIVGDHLELEFSPRMIWIRTINNGPDFQRPKRWIFNPELVLSYYPDKDKGSGAFFRWMIFDDWNRSAQDIMFWQMGYKVNFNELFKKLVK